MDGTEGTGGVAGPPTERGRDLLLLALAFVVINEGVFLARMAWLGAGLVPSFGRFAFISGLAWMTWQGFTVSRWLLVVLVASYIVFGPGSLLQEYRAGSLLFAAVQTLTFLAYVIAGWLLALSPDVSRHIRYRAELRNRDIFRG